MKGDRRRGRARQSAVSLNSMILKVKFIFIMDCLIVKRWASHRRGSGLGLALSGALALMLGVAAPASQEHAVLALWADELHLPGSSRISRRLQREEQPQPTL